LSPTKIIGFMMGVWFLATASSEFIAAIVSDMASVGLEDKGNFILAKAGYINLYEYLFYAGIASGIILILVTPFIKKLMHGIK